MFRFRLVFICCLLNLFAFGQGVNTTWMLGYRSGFGPPMGGINFEFNTGGLSVSYQPRPMNIATTTVVMCNDLGSVLFYSNGAYIANALDDTMMNGSGLSPGHYTDQVGWDGLFIPQASFSVPWPEQPGKYLFFHCTIDDDVNYLYTRRIYLSTIDMSLDNGLGAVLNKNSILLADTFIIGRITGVKHANGRDWWLVVHGCNNDKFYIFKIDPSGISLHAVQSIGQPLISAQGQVCFSPDGSKYALYDRINNLNLFDFDRCSGTFSNPIHITLPGPSGGGGVAFSGNSNVLYVSSNTSIFQFDMTATSIVSSQTTVAVYDGYYDPTPAAATTFFLAQLAPDNKIYISSANGVLSMHVINYPDSLGLACDVCQHCIPLPAYHIAGVPNHPNYFLGAESGSVCDSLSTAIPFTGLPTANEYVLFPNPVRDKMYIQSGSRMNVQDVTLYNTLHQPIFVPMNSINNGEYLELNTSNLTSGIYFVEITSPQGRTVKRMVKE